MKINAKVLWGLLGTTLLVTGMALRYIWYDHLEDDRKERMRDRAFIEELQHEGEVTDEAIDSLSDNLAECLRTCP